ncbi:MAG: LysE family transporter, partial [Chloroflexi bacterium]|nr:LysE family transporter [Chloroflexota bacterium]
MDLSLLWRGTAIGFAIAAPVGPIGLLCIQRTLRNGRTYGFVSGLGAASADAVYGAIAGFGLTAVSNILIAQQNWFSLVGGLFLLYLGLRTFFAPLAAQAADVSAGARGNGLWGAYGSIFLLTLTNPITILSFVAIFAGLGLAADKRTVGEAMTLVGGVTLGSAAWWLLLSGGV